jgi:hypothetical protein
MMHFFREKSLCRTRTPIRVPSRRDFDSYRGGHTPQKWARLSHDWRCPSCKRSKFEQLRWTKSISGFGVPKGEYQWLAPIHEHHDHGADGGENVDSNQERIKQECLSMSERVKSAGWPPATLQPDQTIEPRSLYPPSSEMPLPAWKNFR